MDKDRLKKMRWMISFLMPFCLLVCMLAKIDRIFFKANKGFCFHFIDRPLTDSSWETEGLFPAHLLSQPFSYLGKGAQTFVFESQDKNYVLKFYKFPSHMRRFSWISHPFGYLFSPKRIALKEHNEKRFALSYMSYFLAFQQLQKESGVVYVHLHPTTHLRQTIQLKDKTGNTYQIPCDEIGFVLQRKGVPFVPLLQSALADSRIETAQQMIDSLLQLIVSRCSKGITDLDNMDHDNYGWSEGQAMHLDIGRFMINEEVKKPSVYQQEVVRVTSPLADYLQKKSPELFRYYQQKIHGLSIE